MLNIAASLRKSFVEREFFDPTNEKHLASLDVFLKTGNWGNVQFYPELPFIEVPITVMTKYALHLRGVTPETAEEHTARLASKNLVVPKKETKDERKERLAQASVKINDEVSK